MKTFLSLIVALAIGSANAECLETMERAALAAAAYNSNVALKQIKVIRSEMGMWTEAVGNNTGSGEFALLAKNEMIYLRVFAKQKGKTAECNVLSVEKMSVSEIDALALQAEKYKLAIGTALHISEGDAEWSAFYRHAQVTDFTQEQIAIALNLSGYFEIYSQKLTLEFLEDYAFNEDDEVDAPKYQALLELMKKDFKKFRLIKVGQPDSGGLDLYLIGITPQGDVVGLKTITVET